MPMEGGCLLYSMWDGYRTDETISAFLHYMEEKDISVEQLHTSGHADIGAFDQLIEQTKPHYILPVHTENASWFERYKSSEIIYDKVCKL